MADRVIEILASEPNVVELASPQFIVGDVHGQFYDFLKMIREVSTTYNMQFLLIATASFWATTSIVDITQFRLFATCLC